MPANDRVVWAEQPGNRRKVDAYMVRAAVYAYGEVHGPSSAMSSAQHTLRVAYAANVLDGTADVTRMGVGVAMTNTNVGTAIDSGLAVSSADIEIGVNSLFSKYAGWDGS